MNQFAGTFSGAEVAIQTTDHTQGVPDDEVEKGAMRVKRSGGKSQILIELKGANARTAVLLEQTAEIYYPKLNEIEIYDIRSYKNSVQALSSLGFGMSGKEIAANYIIQTLRHETLASQAVTYVELIPHSPDVLKLVKSIELWISDTTQCPVRQILHQPGGDFRSTEFSALQLNPKFAPNAFDLPKNAKRVRIN